MIADSSRHLGLREAAGPTGDSVVLYEILTGEELFHHSMLEWRTRLPRLVRRHGPLLPAREPITVALYMAALPETHRPATISGL